MVRAITLAEKNKPFIIKNLLGSEKSKTKLLERGFCIGGKISILADESLNCIVKINESKYVLNMGLASKIMVDEYK